MLDALRQHHGTSQNPDPAPRRNATEENVLASLGYESQRQTSSGFGPALRVVLAGVLVIVVGVLLWQVAAMNGLVPSGPFSGSASSRQATLLPPERPQPVPRSQPSTSAPSTPAVPAPALPALPATSAAAGGTAATVPLAPPDARPAERSGVETSTVVEAPKPTRPPRTTVPAGRRTGSSVPRAAPPAAYAPRPTTLAPISAPRGATVVPSIYRSPNGEVDRFKLALYYQRNGDFENALVQYRAVLETNELNAEAHNNLGLLYQEKGLYDEAIREFRRATFIDPRYDKAHNNLGVALLRSGKTDAAVSEFRSIVARDAKNIEALTNLALGLKSSDRSDEAREMLLRALGINGKYAPAHHNLALIYEETGDLVRAIEHYEQYLALAGAENAALTSEIRGRVQTLQSKLIPKLD